MNKNSTEPVIEIDCPWFDPAWLVDHPEFPLSATVADERDIEKESQ